MGIFGAATMLKFWSFLVSFLHNLSLNSQPQHDDQSHDDLESNRLDQLTQPSPQASNSDQTRCYHDIKQKDCPMSPNSSASSSTNTTSTLPLSSAHENPTRSRQGPHDHANPSHPLPLHPIIEIIRQHELGKHVLILAVPMTIGLFSIYDRVNAPLVVLHVMAVAISLGFVGIWDGILLRTSFPEASNIIELLGIAFMFLAYFGFVACFLPENLIWLPYLCWLLSVVPFINPSVFRGSTGKERARQSCNNGQHRPHV